MGCSLNKRVCLSQRVVLLNIPYEKTSQYFEPVDIAKETDIVLSLPRIADPNISSCDGGMIPARLHHVCGQLSLLRLVLVLLTL